MNGTGNGEITDNKGEIKVIIRTLACVLVICVIGVLILIFCKKEIPTELWLLTSNCFTALATMLVKTAPTSSSPAEPKIVNPPAEPVLAAPQPPTKT
jgi:hypothetical protein